MPSSGDTQRAGGGKKKATEISVFSVPSLCDYCLAVLRSFISGLLSSSGDVKGS